MDAWPAPLFRRGAPPPATAPSAGAGAPGTMDIGEFHRILTRRRRLLAPCLAITGALWLAYVVTTPTRYAATMSILIDPRERIPVGLDAAPMPQNPDIALVESEMRILTSKVVLRKLVEDQHLLEDPDYRAGAIREIFASLTSLLRAGAPDANARAAALVESLSKDISIKRSERNYIIDVEVRAGSPEKAEKLAHGLADAFFADQSAMSDDTVAKQSAWLDSRLGDLRTRVEAAERRAQDYRDAQSIVLSDGRVSPETQLKDANDALVAARGKRAEVEARYNQIRAATAPGANAESINDAIHSPVIEKLRADQSALSRDEAYERSVLGPRHPSYQTTLMQLSATQAQIGAELKRIEAATERELKAAESAEKDAAKLVETLEETTQKYADRRVGLGQLESEAATLRADYEKMLTTRVNVRRDVVDSPHATLVDPPVAASSRVSPKISLAAFIALAGGLNLWVIAALAAEYRERGGSLAPEPPSRPLGRREEDNEAGTAEDGLLFAMSAPDSATLATKAGVGVAAVETALRDDAGYDAAIKALRRRIAAIGGASRSAPVVAVAARSRGDGATTLALALACSACADGKRALVIDCDYRRPWLSAITQQLRKAIVDAPGQVAGVLSRDGISGGEALALPFDERGRRSLHSGLQAKFDLVLLDCGPLATAAAWLGDEKTANALLIVDATGSDPSALAATLGRLGIANLAAGLVRRPPKRARAAA
jgi:succinoglycan biosynthesis transport protein ExoP